MKKKDKSTGEDGDDGGEHERREQQQRPGAPPSDDPWSAALGVASAFDGGTEELYPSLPRAMTNERAAKKRRRRELASFGDDALDAPVLSARLFVPAAPAAAAALEGGAVPPPLLQEQQEERKQQKRLKGEKQAKKGGGKKEGEQAQRRQQGGEKAAEAAAEAVAPAATAADEGEQQQPLSKEPRAASVAVDEEEAARRRKERKERRKTAKKEKRAAAAAETAAAAAAANGGGADAPPPPKPKRCKNKFKQPGALEAAPPRAAAPLAAPPSPAAAPPPPASAAAASAAAAAAASVLPAASSAAAAASGGSRLLDKMRARLSGGQFRQLNEALYTRGGGEALALMGSDPSLFAAYHAGFQEQTRAWPAQPADLAAAWAARRLARGAVLADFGCGDGRLSRALAALGAGVDVRGLDLVATAPGTIACNMAETPLATGSCDAAVFSLALMGTDYGAFLGEARRVLRAPAAEAAATGGGAEGEGRRGLLWIAEVRSRFVPGGADREDFGPFLRCLRKLGFRLERQDASNRMFVVWELRLEAEGAHGAGAGAGVQSGGRRKSVGGGVGGGLGGEEAKRLAARLEWPPLRACVYKKR